MAVTFQELTSAEQDWLRDQLLQAAVFAGSFHVDTIPTLTALDKAWSEFIDLGSAADQRANEVVMCVGAAFGEHLVRQLGFAWCIATDEWGTDIAVRARPGRGDITIYPTDYVSKRWESKESEFLVDSIRAIHDTLLDVAKEWGES